MFVHGKCASNCGSRLACSGSSDRWLLNRGAFVSSDDFPSEPGDTMPSVDHIGCLFNMSSSHTLASVCFSTGEPEWARVPVRGPCSSAGMGD